MISLVLAAIILFCIGFSLCSHAKESGDYLIFGDSITTGYGLADKTMRFATLVSNKLGIAERNYGVDGATSADLLTKINGSGNKAQYSGRGIYFRFDRRKRPA